MPHHSMSRHLSLTILRQIILKVTDVANSGHKNALCKGKRVLALFLPQDCNDIQAIPLQFLGEKNGPEC
jgi:hypothetical protein